MAESTSATIEFPALAAGDVLTEILRVGARQMLATAIEAEVAEFLFELVMRRYETRSTMMTTNRPVRRLGQAIG
jgi:hypothetical protein